MLVVIDTNVMLSAFARHSPTVPLFRVLRTGRLRLAVTASIILELQFAAAWAWPHVQCTCSVSSQQLTRPSWSSAPRFQFQVIAADPDDNKFTDCAITADADYIITEDAHFAPLANAGYKPQPIAPMEFIRRFLSLETT